MQGKEVRVKWYELDLAATVGIHRHISSVLRKDKDAHGFAGDGWGANIEGAIGEFVVAKLFDRHWDGSVNTFRTKNDVGLIEVRNRAQRGYDLDFRPDDKEENLFVLVNGPAPIYLVVGWMYGHECKKQEYWGRYDNSRPQCWWVPGGDCHPLSTLPEIEDRPTLT